MDEPPAKRMKFAVEKEPIPEPIIYTCPGHKADVRITVFGQDFYVHSALMKIYSAWFRTAINWADDQGYQMTGNAGSIPAPDYVDRHLLLSGPGSDVTYHFVTKVDKDDPKGWYLVLDKPKNQPYNLDQFTGFPWGYKWAFKNLLHAIYQLPYSFEAEFEPVYLAKLADYYCALPTVARSLDGALRRSPNFGTYIEEHPVTLAKVAIKLRNAMLFRDCMVWLVGLHYSPKYKKLVKDDEDTNTIRATAERVHKRMTKELKAFVEWAEKGDMFPYRIMIRDTGDGERGPYMARFPSFAKSELGEVNKLDWESFGPADAVMKNSLVLDFVDGYPKAGGKIKEGGSGKDYSTYFFFATVKDSELPWEPEEMDW